MDNNVKSINTQANTYTTQNSTGGIGSGNITYSGTTLGGTAGITIGPGTSGYAHTVPNYIWTQPQYPVTPSNEARIRKVENGWIFIYNNKEYVLVESSQALKYLELIGT